MLLPSFAAEQVTGGSIKVDVKFGIFTVYDKTLDLCDLAKQAGMACPIAAGSHTTKVTENVPDVPISVRKKLLFRPGWRKGL